ncbi:hypothetical protein [Vibrio agarivorans]|uniref:hypothetical protein n=1 Tax=Vibrio agarivorans TaxID=153622 RepID=UPI00222E10A2|nr:hypothetical protein [Vibrio agarivorans]MDN3663465.1 hypothetical protein [Vibrio agarivorans]
MNKNIIALAILSTVSTGVFASNAVLNVEGQIQINGVTVIGSDGKVAASALPESNTVVIDLDTYSAANGKYTFEYYRDRYMTDDGSGWVTFETVCTETDNFISDTEYEFSSKCVDQDGFVSMNYSEIWKDNGDGTETITWVNTYEGQETRESQVRKIDVLSEYASQVVLGQTTAYSEHATILEDEGIWYEAGDNWFFARTKSVVSLIESVTLGENTFNDCILVQRDGYWNGASSLDIHCANIGLVAKTIDREYAMEYKLVSYEQAQSNTVRAQSLNEGVYSKEVLSERARNHSAKQLNANK